MPWLLTVVLLLFVSATSALAQWQTRIDIVIYSLSNDDFRKDLQNGKLAAEHDGNYAAVARFDFMLNRQDPSGYIPFASNLKKLVQDWVDSESKDVLRGKVLQMTISPYSMTPPVGDVEIIVIWNGNAVRNGVNIKDGAKSALESVKKLILGTKITPTSTKKA